MRIARFCKGTKETFGRTFQVFKHSFFFLLKFQILAKPICLLPLILYHPHLPFFSLAILSLCSAREEKTTWIFGTKHNVGKGAKVRRALQKVDRWLRTFVDSEQRLFFPFPFSKVISKIELGYGTSSFTQNLFLNPKVLCMCVCTYMCECVSFY